MSKERFVRGAFAGLAALGLAAGADASAQTIKGSESGQTTNAAAERPWQPSPSVEPAMRVIFDPSVTVEYNGVYQDEQGGEMSAAFHALDTRGRRALYEVTMAMNPQGERSLDIKVCNDPRGDEIGSELVACSAENDSVEFTDLDADGTVDRISAVVPYSLVPGSDLNITRGQREWSPTYQRRYEETLATIARFIANQGRERM